MHLQNGPVFFWGVSFPQKKSSLRKKGQLRNRKKTPKKMDSYLRDVGIEMQTYAVNGVRVATDRDKRPCSYEAIVRGLLIAHMLRRSGL